MQHFWFVIVLFLFQASPAQEAPQEAPQVEDQNIYHMSDIDVQPKYKEGKKKLAHFFNSKFNSLAIREDIGQMIVRFLIEKDGTCSKTEVLKDMGPHNRKELIKVFNKLKGTWIPGQHNGKIVRSYYVLVIHWGN